MRIPCSTGFFLLITIIALPTVAKSTNDPIMMDYWPPYYRPLEAFVRSGVPIQWINITASSHTVRHDDCTIGNICAFDSGPVAPGQTYTLPGLPPGRYSYHCELHPLMGGTLIVED